MNGSPWERGEKSFEERVSRFVRKSPREWRREGARAFELGEHANPYANPESVAQAYARECWQVGHDDAASEYEKRIEREERERAFSALETAVLVGDADSVTMLELCRAVLELHARLKKLEGVE